MAWNLWIWNKLDVFIVHNHCLGIIFCNSLKTFVILGRFLLTNEGKFTWQQCGCYWREWSILVCLNFPLVLHLEFNGTPLDCTRRNKAHHCWLRSSILLHLPRQKFDIRIDQSSISQLELIDLEFLDFSVDVIPFVLATHTVTDSTFDIWFYKEKNTTWWDFISAESCSLGISVLKHGSILWS